MASKVLIAIPSPMLADVDMVAEAEHRTRSDLIREALRRYIEFYKKKNADLTARRAASEVDGNGVYV